MNWFKKLNKQKNNNFDFFLYVGWDITIKDSNWVEKFKWRIGQLIYENIELILSIKYC